MMLTGLAAACRNAGLNVIEVPGWATRGHGGLTDVRTIVDHHTAGPSAAHNPSDYPSLGVTRDGRPGLPGPLCNLGLGRSGRVYVIAAGLAYHAGQVRDVSYGNSHSIGIEAENDGVGEPWPAVQLAAYALLDAALCDAYGVPVARVLGHKEVCAPVGRKIDPDIDMAALRAQVAIDLAKLRGGGTGGDPGHGGGGTSGHQVVTLRRELLVRTPMQHGDDVKAVQRIVGAKPDGWYGPMTASAVRIWQRRHGLVSDGIVGPKTAASLSLHWAG